MTSEIALPRIAIILGSTRPGRRGAAIADWVYELATKRDDASFELIDLINYPLPHLDESVPPSAGKYANKHTKDWARLIAGFDGFVFVTPEYNHGVSGVLKNAIDFVYAEWNNKAASFVSYGVSSAGTRAVEHLRLVMAELQVADVRAQVAISVPMHFEGKVFNPDGVHEAALATQFDQLIRWSKALRTVRTGT